jgi:hypothetical protein
LKNNAGIVLIPPGLTSISNSVSPKDTIVMEMAILIAGVRSDGMYISAHLTAQRFVWKSLAKRKSLLALYLKVQQVCSKVWLGVRG